MTTHEPAETVYPFPMIPPAPTEGQVPVSRPMPRLGHGIVWSDIVAEIERDERERRMRDAA